MFPGVLLHFKIAFGCLPAVRAAPSDDLPRHSPLPNDIQALVGTLFPTGDSERDGRKLRPRKATRGGAILMRPCFCDGDDMGGNGICPVRDFWPVVCRSSLWEEPLFPPLRSKNINRILKGMLRPTKVAGADSYSAHAFRRCASMEIGN